MPDEKDQKPAEQIKPQPTPAPLPKPVEGTQPQPTSTPLPKPKPVVEPLRFETFSEGYDPSKIKTLKDGKKDQ